MAGKNVKFFILGTFFFKALNIWVECWVLFIVVTWWLLFYSSKVTFKEY